MATGDMHKTFGEDRSSSSGDIRADRHIDRLIKILRSLLRRSKNGRQREVHVVALKHPDDNFSTKNRQYLHTHHPELHYHARTAPDK